MKRVNVTLAKLSNFSGRQQRSIALLSRVHVTRIRLGNVRYGRSLCQNLAICLIAVIS
jgi:hypothetical protein